MAAEAGELEAVFRLSDQITPRMPALVSAVEKADQAVGLMADSVEGLNETLDPAPIEEWAESQQRLKMRMESAHEAALKMNAGFSSTDDKAQLFSATLGKATSLVGAHGQAITQLGAAFGVPLAPLGALASATDVTALGFRQMTTSAVGFNAGSVAVVGAGLAVGGAIGTMIVKLTEGEKEYEAIAAAALDFFGILERSTGPATTNVAKMGAIQAQVQQNVINVMRSQGKTTDEIVAQLTGKYVPALDKVVDGLRKQEDAQKKSAEAVKKAKDAYEEWLLASAKFATATLKEWEENEVKRLEAIEEAAKKAKQAEVGLILAIANSTKEGVKANEDWLKKQQEMADDYGKKQLNRLKQEAEDQEEHRERIAQSLSDLGDSLTLVGDIFVMLGGDADSFFVRLTDGFSRIASAAGDFMSAFAKHDLMGMIKAGLSGVVAVIGTIKSLFGDKEWEKVNDLRDEFVAAAGGIDKLNQRAVAAGLSLDRLLDAKKVKDYEEAVEMLNLQLEFIEGRGGLRELQAAAERAGISLQAMFDAKSAEALKLAIDDIGRGLDTWNEAMRLTQEAMDKYGITVDQMGAKFAQQKLDEQAMQLFQDYSLLTAAGADHNLVIEKMAPSINEYVQTALRAGASIPESMRPIIESMIENGQLLDENGNAYASAEEAGITYAMSTSEAIKLLIDKITELVNALLGIPTNINTNVNTDYTTSGTPPGDPGDHHGGEHHAAHGFHGMVYRPTRFLGPERVDVSPAGGGSMGGGGGSVGPVTINIDGYNRDPRELAEEVARQIFRGAGKSYLRDAVGR